MRKLLLAGSTLLALAASVAPFAARAAYIVTLTQEGSNVVADGSGTIDTDGMLFDGTGNFISGLIPDTGVINTGPVSGNVGSYIGIIGPSNFGNGSIVYASSGSGDAVGVDGASGIIRVPAGYVSGSALADSSTYDNQTFSSLGVTPGTYVYDFGSGADADTFTVQIGGTPSVPEPASLALFGTGMVGLGLIRRHRRG